MLQSDELIAEEVAAVNPDLVVRDEKGEIYTVRYDAVNAMLLNEFLKEHGKVQEQDAIIAQVKSNAAKQEATIAELKSGMENSHRNDERAGIANPESDLTARRSEYVPRRT